MVQPDIFVRRAIPSDTQYVAQVTGVVNAAYSSGGKLFICVLFI